MNQYANKLVSEELLTKRLRALNSIPRLKILICLGERPKNVSEMISVCTLSQSAVSQHLAKLKNAGFVTCDCVGREKIYRLTDQRYKFISEILINS
jgi:ArsR family transcriptional regulator